MIFKNHVKTEEEVNLVKVFRSIRKKPRKKKAKSKGKKKQRRKRQQMARPAHLSPNFHISHIFVVHINSKRS